MRCTVTQLNYQIKSDPRALSECQTNYITVGYCTVNEKK